MKIKDTVLRTLSAIEKKAKSARETITSHSECQQKLATAQNALELILHSDCSQLDPNTAIHMLKNIALDGLQRIK